MYCYNNKLIKTKVIAYVLSSIVYNVFLIRISSFSVEFSCTYTVMYLSLFLHAAMNRETVKCYVLKIWKFLPRFKALPPLFHFPPTCSDKPLQPRCLLLELLVWLPFARTFHLPIMLCALRCAALRLASAPELSPVRWLKASGSSYISTCGIWPIGFSSSHDASLPLICIAAYGFLDEVNRYISQLKPELLIELWNRVRYSIPYE